MRSPMRALLLLVAAHGLALPVYGQHGHGGGNSSSSRSSSGGVHVRGYTSRSGKSVQPYTRNAPGEGRSRASGPRASTSTRSPRVSTPRSVSPGSLTVSHPRATPNPTRGARDGPARLKPTDMAKHHFLRQSGHPH